MRIKLTEEQYALLNEYVNGAKNISEEEEIEYEEPEVQDSQKNDNTPSAGASKDFEDIILQNVKIDDTITQKINTLILPKFPKNFLGGKGQSLTKSLQQRLLFLSNPGEFSGKGINNMINAMYILSYLKELSDGDKFEPSTSGFFFESFIAGILGVTRADESGKGKGAADIDINGSTWSLKLYSDDDHPIQVKSQDQTINDVTKGIILGVKRGNVIEIYIYEIERSHLKNIYGKPNELALSQKANWRDPREIPEAAGGIYRNRYGVVNKDGKKEWYYGDVWLIKQSYVKEHSQEKAILNFGDVAGKLEKHESTIGCVMKEMTKQMTDMQVNIKSLLTSKDIRGSSEKAKEAGIALIDTYNGTNDKSRCQVKSDKEGGLVDKTVDILTKYSDVKGK